MTDEDLRRRLAAAEAVAREAGALAVKMRAGGGDLGRAEKGELDFSTAADLALEELIVARLGAAFGDPVMGEELGGAPGDTLWVVDPIDGTYNFFHGLPHWCVSIAFVHRGEAEIGVLFNPETNELFAARRGQGATLNGLPLRVSGGRHNAPLVEVGRSNRRPLARYLEVIRRLTEGGCEFRRLGSGALGMGWVAAGRTDAYFELHINAWDVLAGLVICREAGAWTNDFLAGEGLAQGNAILGCTPELADRLLRLIDLPDLTPAVTSSRRSATA